MMYYIDTAFLQPAPLYDYGIKIIETVQFTKNAAVIFAARLCTDGLTFFLPILLIAAFMWCADYKKGFRLAYGLAFSFAFSEALKNLLKISRPFTVKPSLGLYKAHGYASPSAHTAGAFFFYTSFFFAAKGNRLKKVLAVIAVLLPITVGFIRIYLGVSYISSIVQGIAAGLIAVLFLGKDWDNEEAGNSCSNTVCRIIYPVKLFLCCPMKEQSFTFFEQAEKTLGKTPSSFRFAASSLTALLLLTLCGAETAPCGVLTGLAFGKIYILERSGKSVDASAGTLTQKICRFLAGIMLTTSVFLILSFFEVWISDKTLYAYTKILRFSRFFVSAAFFSGVVPLAFLPKVLRPRLSEDKL